LALNGGDSQRNTLAALNPQTKLGTYCTGSYLNQNAGQNE